MPNFTSEWFHLLENARARSHEQKTRATNLIMRTSFSTKTSKLDDGCGMKLLD